MSEKNEHISLDNRVKPDLSDAVSSYAVPESRSKEEVWKSIEKSISGKKTKHSTHKPLKIHPAVWYTAASILIIIAGMTLKSTGIKTFNSPLAKHIRIELPDGSKVIMNAGSQITYKKKDWLDNRIVRLKGEAFFEVSKGKSFVVECRNGNVSVLGTVFNVNSGKQYLKVSCFTGSVGVSGSTGDDQVILKPNQAVNIKSGAEQLPDPYVFNDASEASWRWGEFYFSNEKLGNVFNQLEKQYNIRVSGDYPKDASYTGSFNNRDLATALEMVCAPMLLEYTIIKKKVVINKKH